MSTEVDRRREILKLRVELAEKLNRSSVSVLDYERGGRKPWKAALTGGAYMHMTADAAQAYLIGMLEGLAYLSNTLRGGR